METKINIAEILKDKPQGTKLYDWLHNIDVELDTVSTTDTETVVWCTNETDNNTTCHRGYSEFGTERGYPHGLQILFPSKEMRDWRKFAWKKGDILVGYSKTIVFNGFTDDTYTLFKGKYCLQEDRYSDKITYIGEDKGLLTKSFHIPEQCTAQAYIKVIEKRFGGKLNRKTFEVEVDKPEFKDGDFICYTSLDGDKCIGIVKETENDAIVFHVKYDVWMHNMEFNVSISKENHKFCKSNDLDDEMALNEALHIRNQSWDAEKKMIVELKPKVELKPFDKVITRNASDDVQTANIFSHIDSHGEYVTIACVGGYTHCIPYNEETAKLIGTTNNWEG